MSRLKSGQSSRFSMLPKFGEWLLDHMLDQADSEVLLGDFAEEYDYLVKTEGVRVAWEWYWPEMLKSTPALLYFVKQKLTGRYIMERLFFGRDHHRLAYVGFFLILPALILCLGGILQSALGVRQFNEAINFDLFVFNPVIIMGGLILAFGLNLIPVIRLKYEDGTLIGLIKIRGNLLNLSLIVLISTVLSVIFLYLLAENFQIFAMFR